MIDPAYLYEQLARYAFNNCSKAKDPWGIAKQEYYSVFVEAHRLNEAKLILGKVFVGLLLKQNSTEDTQKFLVLEDKIHHCKNQTDFLKLINKAFTISELI